MSTLPGIYNFYIVFQADNDVISNNKFVNSHILENKVKQLFKTRFFKIVVFNNSERLITDLTKRVNKIINRNFKN